MPEKYFSAKDVTTAVNKFRFLLPAILIALVSGISAQTIFTDLRAVQYGDSILVNWTLNGGYTCTNMMLQRSTDNIGFEAIYQVNGTCGSTTDQYYSHIDSESLDNSQLYFYRIAASGEFFVSDTVTILFINAGTDEIFAYPNPTDNIMNITVDNDFAPPFILEIFSVDSKQMNYSQLIHANNFILNKGVLPDGFYIIKITTKDRLVLSKSILICTE